MGEKRETKSLSWLCLRNDQHESFNQRRVDRICHRPYYSSLEAEGVVGAAEPGVKWLSDECAGGVFIALTLRHSDDDRWTHESGENQRCCDLVLTDRQSLFYSFDPSFSTISSLLKSEQFLLLC